MDYEQKYNEALERAQRILCNLPEGSTTIRDIESIFPELAESEDERIRKEIISIVKAYRENCIDEGTHRFDDCLSWLEKQKSEKPLIPKKKNDVRKAIEGVIRVYGKTQGEWIAGYDMDTLVVHLRNAFAALEKQKEQKPDIELIQRSWYMEGYHDREFGKEPKWILKTGEGGPKHELNPRYGESLSTEQPKQEWSEEDEENFKWFDKFFRAESVVLGGKEISQDKYLWFKSLRPSWRPSEEQMEALNALNCHGDLSYVGQQNQLISLYDDLKKLM